MSSIFRARRTDEPGSGGKMLRGRRVRPSASPYLRPENSQATPTPESENPRWFSGLISGAGKLLSSVFRPNDSDSSYSSDSDGDCGSSDEEDADASSKEYDELDQTEKKLESTKNFREGPEPVVQSSEAKFAIEQLLLQETFTREECNKLTRLIQSRVVDCSASEGDDAEISKKLYNKTVGSGIAFPGAGQSLNHERKYSEMIPYSACSLNDFSPGSSALRTYTPDLRNTAIKEAKNWLEEKRLASIPKSDLEHGPCTLNTDMLQYARKRSLAIGSLDTLDETRRVRLKSTENMSEPHVFKQVDSSSRMSEHEASLISPEADKRVLEVLGVTNDSSLLPAIKLVGAPAKFPAELAVKDGCPDGVLSTTYETAAKVNLPKNNGVCDETCNHASINISLESQETVDEVGSTLAALPSGATAGNESLACGLSSLVTDKYQDLEQASMIKEQLGNISVTHKSCIQDIPQVEQNVDVVQDLLNSETKVVSSEVISDADEVTNRIDVQTSSLQIMPGTERTIQDNSCSQLDLLSGHKEAYPIGDSRSQDDNDRMQKEPNRLIGRFTASGVSSFPSCSSDGLGTDRSLRSSNNGVNNFTKLSNGELAASIPCELSSLEVPIVVGTNSVVDKPENVTTMKSIKQMLIESQPNSGRGRGRVKRAVARPRRGSRGKGN